MHLSLSLSFVAVFCVAMISAQTAENQQQQKSQLQALPVLEDIPQEAGAGLARDKRTLFLKKKLFGAGLLGFGLGLVKGVKVAGYHSPPEVHHVYLSPPAPQVKYVEYVEKPVFVERIVEKPVHVEYEPAPQWSQPAPSYGPW